MMLNKLLQAVDQLEDSLLLSEVSYVMTLECTNSNAMRIPRRRNPLKHVPRISFLKITSVFALPDCKAIQVREEMESQSRSLITFLPLIALTQWDLVPATFGMNWCKVSDFSSVRPPFLARQSQTQRSQSSHITTIPIDNSLSSPQTRLLQTTWPSPITHRGPLVKTLTCRAHLEKSPVQLTSPVVSSRNTGLFFTLTRTWTQMTLYPSKTLSTLLETSHGPRRWSLRESTVVAPSVHSSRWPTLSNSEAPPGWEAPWSRTDSSLDYSQFSTLTAFAQAKTKSWLRTSFASERAEA